MAHLLGLGLSFQGPWKAAGMWPEDPMGMGATDRALPALIQCVLRPLWMVTVGGVWESLSVGYFLGDGPRLGHRGILNLGTLLFSSTWTVSQESPNVS